MVEPVKTGTMGKIVGVLGQFNAATGQAQIAIAGIGLLIAGIRAIIDKAKGAGVDLHQYDEALAAWDAADARVMAELAEYDEIKAAEKAKEADGKSEG